MKLRSMTRIVSDESGATAIEYGLIAALVSVVAIVAMKAVGNSLDDVFNKVSDELDSAKDATAS